MVRPLPKCFYRAPTNFPQSTDMIMVTPMARAPHHRRSLQVSTPRSMNMCPRHLLHATFPRAALASGQTHTRPFTAIRLLLGLRSFRPPRRSHASAHPHPRGERGASRIAHARAPRSTKSITRGLCTTLLWVMARKHPREHPCSLRHHQSTPTHRTRTAAMGMARAGMGIHTAR